MQAPDHIRQVWDQFAGVPMETFTKGWWHQQCGGRPRQRTVAEMAAHRRAHGAGGNCFDLALWLRHELEQAGIPARIVGHDLCTPDAHVALVAAGGDGGEFLCDLGDQWLQPILIAPAAAGFADEWHAGFFPGRSVRISRSDDLLQVYYRRGNGKVGSQSYDLRPVPEEVLQAACHHSQSLLRHPFCEILLPHPATGRIEHWEYDHGASFWKLAEGVCFEEPCQSRAAWSERISRQTGMAADLIDTAFQVYAQC